jgi:predicted Zn-dependent protease
VIPALLVLWFTWQTVSPEALQHMQAATEAEKQKQFDSAVAEFQRVTELEPKLPDGFVRLGQAYMEKHDYGAAIAPLKHALELAQIWRVGYSLLAQGYAAEAIPHLERVQEQTALGIAQIETGQLPQAVTNLQAALATTRTCSTIWAAPVGCYRSSQSTH